MNKPLPGSDERPWYRYFWPWFLMALPAAVVVAGLWTAYIASEHADDLVVDDYYKDGLAINLQLAKKQRATELGISAQLNFSDEIVTVELSGPVADSGLLLILSHPLEADRDFSVPLVRVSPGVYRGSMGQDVAPRWHWTLEGLRRDDWRLDGEIEAPDIDDAAPG
jgi:uncharacterized protein